MDGVAESIRGMMGAIGESLGAVEVPWEVRPSFRAYYDGVFARLLRSWGVGTPFKSILEPVDTMMAIVHKTYVPPVVADGFSNLMRFFGFKRSRFSMARRVVQYMVLGVRTEGCTKGTAQPCTCRVCNDVRLSKDLSMQLRRKDVKYVWYLRMESQMYGLKLLVPQVVYVPFAACQEFMRTAVAKPWSDADFKLFWSELGRLNIDCTGYVAEEYVSHVFCRDWWVASHNSLSMHMPAN